MRDADKVVNIPITNLVGKDYISNISCQKSGHVVTVKFDVQKIQNAFNGTRDSAVLKGFPRSVDKVWVHCISMQKDIHRGFLDEDYFTWHYTSNWEAVTGNECVCYFTYLTND